MGIFKKQAYSAVMAPGLRGVTIGDIAREVKNDMSLAGMERSRLLSQIDAVSGGASPGTPVSALASSVGGAVVASLAGKYFGMSTVGRGLLTAVGFGIGHQLYDRFNPQPARRRNTSGWQFHG